MKRILIVNTVPTDGNGITNVIFNYIKNIDIQKAHIDLVSINTPEDSYYKVIQQQNGTIFVLDRNTKHLYIYIKKLISLMKPYDVVHVHGNSSSMILELFAAFCAGVKIRVAHGHSATCNNIRLHTILRPLLNRLSTKRVACSVKSGDFTFGKAPYTVLRNCFDVVAYGYNKNERERLRKRFGVDQFAVLGHVGRFNSYKNHRFIIKVFKELQSIDKDLRLVLIGDGPLKNSIEKQVMEENLDQFVQFLGNIDYADKVYNMMDCFIMPSVSEGFGSAAVEAQANGLPTILSEAVSPEVKINNNCFFVSLDASLDEWCSLIIDNINNRELNGNKNVISAGYAVEEVMKSLEEIYGIF